MASGKASSTYERQLHLNSKPPILPPTSVFSFQQVDQLYKPSKTKPPPVPKKRAKSTTNYDLIVRKCGSVSTPSSASCSVLDFKPTAGHAAGGSDDYYQNPDKVHTFMPIAIIVGSTSV